MATLLQEIIKGYAEGETIMGSPTYIYKGETYPCIPSVTDFKRDLLDGGFRVDKLLKMTLRKYDTEDNLIYSTYPTAQEVLTYQGLNYRIETVKHDPTGAYFCIIAMSTTKGI